MKQTSKFYAVILAGGKGERFWPMSRANFPKQFISLFGKDSLIQQTYKRINKLIPLSRQFYVIPKRLVPILKNQIPLTDKNIIIEPIGRNTAPAIALSAIYLEKLSPNSTMIVLPADHLISQEDKFYDCVKFAYEIAQNEYLVTFGIPPTSPDTGYGYIHVGERYKAKGKIQSFYGKRFVEKPNLKLAKQYLKAKTYFWNSGMFVWKTSTILTAIQQCLPEFHDVLKYFQKMIGTNKEQKLLNKIYEKAPATSIDYAVLEKVKNIVVIKANFLWDDVGSWLALERHFDKDISGNVKIGNYVAKDTKNSIIVSNQNLIAAMGVKGLIIINTKDATLVISKEKSTQLKELIKLIGENPKGKKYL
ncbi:MAG: mannose-1-phosphate guanylyltransferase [candidate division WOR-3 bacterium]